MINVDALGLDRQDLLCAFLRKKKLTLKQLSKKTGFSEPTMLRLRAASHISHPLYKALSEVGIPAELLPEPKPAVTKIHHKD